MVLVLFVIVFLGNLCASESFEFPSDNGGPPPSTGGAADLGRSSDGMDPVQFETRQGVFPGPGAIPTIGPTFPPGGVLPPAGVPPGGQLPPAGVPPGGQLPPGGVPPGGQLPPGGVPPGGVPQGAQLPPGQPFPTLGPNLPLTQFPNNLPQTQFPNIPQTFPTLPTQPFPPANNLPAAPFPPVVGQQTCVCAPIGQCQTSGSIDGTGVIDIRIVSTGVGGGIGPLPTGGSDIVTNIVSPPNCAPGLQLCCQGGSYQCGIRYPPVAQSPPAAPGQAPYGAYPWQAVLLSPGNVYAGSGVLIDNRHVLTAAHKIVNFTPSLTTSMTFNVSTMIDTMIDFAALSVVFPHGGQCLCS